MLFPKGNHKSLITAFFVPVWNLCRREMRELVYNFTDEPCRILFFTGISQFSVDNKPFHPQTETQIGGKKWN